MFFVAHRVTATLRHQGHKGHENHQVTLWTSWASWPLCRSRQPVSVALGTGGGLLDPAPRQERRMARRSL